MIILIDADGCPVVESTLRIAKEHKIECTILCDTSHSFDRIGATIIQVSKGAVNAGILLTPYAGSS